MLILPKARGIKRHTADSVEYSKVSDAPSSKGLPGWDVGRCPRDLVQFCCNRFVCSGPETTRCFGKCAWPGRNATDVCPQADVCYAISRNFALQAMSLQDPFGLNGNYHRILRLDCNSLY